MYQSIVRSRFQNCAKHHPHIRRDLDRTVTREFQSTSRRLSSALRIYGRRLLPIDLAPVSKDSSSVDLATRDSSLFSIVQHSFPGHGELNFTTTPRTYAGNLTHIYGTYANSNTKRSHSSGSMTLVSGISRHLHAGLTKDIATSQPSAVFLPISGWSYNLAQNNPISPSDIISLDATAPPQRELRSSRSRRVVGLAGTGVPTR